MFLGTHFPKVDDSHCITFIQLSFLITFRNNICLYRLRHPFKATESE